MNEELSLYENLKMLIEIERESGTSSLFSMFAVELLRTLEEQKEIIDRADEACDYGDAWRRGYADDARSEAVYMWNKYSDFYDSIMGL